MKKAKLKTKLTIDKMTIFKFSNFQAISTNCGKY